MVGFYNYTVILTYFGVVSAVLGIGLSMYGRTSMAVVCLMVSGFCDLFDGSIARTRERTENEKKFGIQIDSLADMVCFGVLPAAIGFSRIDALVRICGVDSLCACRADSPRVLQRDRGRA